MMRDCTYHIGVLIFDFFIPEAQSLKDKRMVLRSLKGRIESKFKVVLAELDTEDKWQTAICGVTLIGNDQRYLDQCLQSIVSFVESCSDLQISDYQITFL